MRKIGKMCKKEINENGHYFSNINGFITASNIDCRIKDKIKQLCELFNLYKINS